jgi:SPRY domain
MSVNSSPLLLGDDGYQISRSVRLRSSASAYFNRTPAAATNQTTWTISKWAKLGALNTLSELLNCFNAAQNKTAYLRVNADNTLTYFDYNATGGVFINQITTTQVFRDPSAWYHIVLAYDTGNATASDRLRLYINGVRVTALSTASYPTLNYAGVINTAALTTIGKYANASTGYFDGYLTEVNFIDGQALPPSSFGQFDPATGVWGAKKYTGTYGTNGFYLPFNDPSAVYPPLSGVGSNIGTLTTGGGLAAAFNGNYSTNYPSCAYTTGTGTLTGYVGKDWGAPVLVKGFRVFSNTSGDFVSGSTQVTVELQGSTDNFASSVVSLYTSGTITNTGAAQQVVQMTTGLGSTAYRYHRIKLTEVGSYGASHALFLSQVDFFTNANIGADRSGNQNDWYTNNISVTAGVTYDSMLDVPTMWADGGNGRGNYATLNPLGKASTAVLSDGNLSLSNSGSTTYPAASAGIYPTSGSWYFEATLTGSGTQECCVGMSNLTNFASLTFQTAAGNVFWNSNNGIYKDGLVFTGGAGKTFTFGDVIGVAYDITAGTITFYKNGAAQTPVVTGVGASYSPTLGFNFYTAGVLSLNCGQRPFTYTPPTGFKALNTQNLPDATIKAGNKFFDVSTYTGNGSAVSVVNGGAFQPDMVWVKGRSVVANHILVDSVRGVTKDLSSNTTSAEATVGDISAFNSNGFTAQYVTGETNASGSTYVGWQWKKGAAQGFDVVTYTGTGATLNVNHSLGVKPAMVITKSRSAVANWDVWHQSIGDNFVRLNTTAAQLASTSNGVFNTASITTTQVQYGNSGDLNTNGATYVSYLFAEVAGFSKFGSYTGNGSADGPFVYCGFRPRFVMIKRTDTTEQWRMWDTARDAQVQPSGYELYPNLSNSEAPTTNFDYLSNGFKLRAAVAGINASGGTYIFAAFAENPFKNSLAR